MNIFDLFFAWQEKSFRKYLCKEYMMREEFCIAIINNDIEAYQAAMKKYRKSPGFEPTKETAYKELKDLLQDIYYYRFDDRGELLNEFMERHPELENELSRIKKEDGRNCD